MGDEIDALIGDVIVDAYSEHEQHESLPTRPNIAAPSHSSLSGIRVASINRNRCQASTEAASTSAERQMSASAAAISTWRPRQESDL